MKNFRITFLFFFFSKITFLVAQDFPRASIPFYTAGELIENALTGGLNSPQLSEVDLNADGLMDLFIFDRVGFKARCFLNRGAPNKPDYIWAPLYEERFPELRQWALLRDFNADGAMDIFAYSDVPGVDGVIVFRGRYEEDGIHFERADFPGRFNILTYNFNTNAQIYITGIDYPAVDDVDCDGDLDILTFNAIAPGRLEFYRNESVERNLDLDSLVFRLADRCWGGFFESGLSPSVDLASAPGDCIENFQIKDPQVQFRHAGSTVLSLDIDSDEDKDLIIGDLSFTRLNRLLNGGNCQQAWINEQDALFPAFDAPVDLPFFPAAYYLDVNNDGRKDLLAAPNAEREAENRDCLWLYENIGDDNLPDFTLRQKNFLVNSMIDLGGRTHPAIVDYNADGLPDLVVGSEGLFVEAGSRKAGLYLFENRGTRLEPEFHLADEDYLGLSAFTDNTFNFSPTFGDLDGDGDLDVVVGEENGRLFYAENTAGLGQVFAFSAWQYPFQDIDVGLNSIPFLYDLNQDGLMDLLVGEFNGNINYFANTGSASNAAFNADPQASPNQFVLGQIDARTPGFDGYSAPWAGKVAGNTQVLTGTEIGRLEAYRLESLEEPFPLLTEKLGGIDLGQASHPALGDLDGDGFYDLVAGTARGGLEIYQTNWEADVSVATVNPVSNSAIRVFPNPVADQLYIETPGPQFQGFIRLYASNGRLIRSTEAEGKIVRLSVKNLPAGVYWLQIQRGQKRWSRKIMLVF